MSDLKDLAVEELARVKKLDAEATPQPWAWQSIAEQSNEFAVGVASRLVEGNECEVSGELDWTDDVMVDVVITQTIGMNESGHANLRDAALIAEYRSLAPRMAAQIERQQAKLRTLRAEVERLTAENANIKTHGGSTCGVFHSQWAGAEMAAQSAVADLRVAEAKLRVVAELRDWLANPQFLGPDVAKRIVVDRLSAILTPPEQRK